MEGQGTEGIVSLGTGVQSQEGREGKGGMWLSLSPSPAAVTERGDRRTDPPARDEGSARTRCLAER